ncbi:MAG: hypothetical protein OXE82_12970 [Rhodobacter sp.]|nr:hypothetical protein [Rhodobacter sp.]
MIDPPHESDGPAVLADWLELVTVLSLAKTGYVDQVLGSADIAGDTDVEDIAAYDAARDSLSEAIGEEIARRLGALEIDAYPFAISKNGEALNLRPELTYGHLAYLSCLLISQSWKSGKLTYPARLTEAELRDARVNFEVLTAVSAVGLATGPSFLLGTNRQGAEGLLKRIEHLCNTVGEGTARSQMHDSAPDFANDDGVDVLAIHQEVDGPPHVMFWFCQSAAGENYRNKPIINEIGRFMEIWFEERPANTSGALFFPATIDNPGALYLTRRLGHLCHRLRMPRYARRGFDLIKKKAELLHYVDDVYGPREWLRLCLERIMIDLST